MMKDPATPLGKRLGIYLFFLAHMTGFGALTFYRVYHAQGGYTFAVIPVVLYVIFYLLFFGADEILWLVITSLLGLLMIYGWLETLALPFIPEPGTAGEHIITNFGTFPARTHILPGAFLVMYEFTLRNMLIDVLGARFNERRNRLVGWLFIAISAVQVLLGGLTD